MKVPALGRGEDGATSAFPLVSASTNSNAKTPSKPRKRKREDDTPEHTQTRSAAVTKQFRKSHTPKTASSSRVAWLPHLTPSSFQEVVPLSQAIASTPRSIESSSHAIASTSQISAPLRSEPNPPTVHTESDASSLQPRLPTSFPPPPTGSPPASDHRQRMSLILSEAKEDIQKRVLAALEKPVKDLLNQCVEELLRGAILEAFNGTESAPVLS